MTIELQTGKVREKVFNDFWCGVVLKRLNEKLNDTGWLAIDGQPWGGNEVNTSNGKLTIVPHDYASNHPAYCIAIEVKSSLGGVFPLIGIIQEVKPGKHEERDREIRNTLINTKYLGKARSSPKWPWFKSLKLPGLKSFKSDNIDAILAMVHNEEMISKNVVAELMDIFENTKKILNTYNNAGQS